MHLFDNLPIDNLSGGTRQYQFERVARYHVAHIVSDTVDSSNRLLVVHLAIQPHHLVGLRMEQQAAACY